MQGTLKLVVSITAGTVLIVSGCTSKTIQVKTSDWQTDLETSIPHAEKLNLCIETFSDVRGVAEENVIGEGKTGMFNKSTPIVIDGSVADLSTRVLREAFTDAGFSLVDEPGADVILRGRINSFWVQEFATGFGPEQTEAEVEFDVVLVDKMRGKNIWFDVKKARVTSKPSGIDITSQNQKVIAQALNEVVAAVVSDAKLTAAINDFIRTKE